MILMDAVITENAFEEHCANLMELFFVARDINSSQIYLSKSSRNVLIQVVEMFRSFRLK